MDMPGKSSITKVVGLRLPVALADKVDRLAKRQGVTVSVYLAKIIGLQVGRKR